MKRAIWIIILLLVLNLLLVACAPAAAQTADEEYIYVSCMGNLEFFNAHKYGWGWAGEALGIKTDYVGPAE